MLYDDHVYRLICLDPFLSIDLPKDMEWIDESSWSPVEQFTEYGLTGALLIQEGFKLKGRTITLSGKDDMSWIQRTDHDILLQMRNIPGIRMTFQFIQRSTTKPYTYSNPRFSYDVTFNHTEGALQLESIKRWDNYEPDTWFKIRFIRLIEVAL